MRPARALGSRAGEGVSLDEYILSPRRLDHAPQDTWGHFTEGALSDELFIYSSLQKQLRKLAAWVEAGHAPMITSWRRNSGRLSRIGASCVGIESRDFAPTRHHWLCPN